MNKKLTAKQIEDSTSIDHVSVRNGIYTARRGYFWGVSASGEAFAQQVRNEIEKAFDIDIVVLDFGNHFTAFKGDAPLTKQSHYWVKFSI